MASTQSSRVNPKYKKRYRVGNWPAYERGLRARGDITVWFAEVDYVLPPGPGSSVRRRVYVGAALGCAAQRPSRPAFVRPSQGVRSPRFDRKADSVKPTVNRGKVSASHVDRQLPLDAR